jgi:hypothetical protein
MTYLWGCSGSKEHTCGHVCALIGQLSNRQLGQTWHRLLYLSGLWTDLTEVIRVFAPAAAGAVAPPRKFMNQKHYSAWLSQVRYLGRNRRSQSR